MVKQGLISLTGLLILTAAIFSGCGGKKEAVSSSIAAESVKNEEITETAEEASTGTAAEASVETTEEASAEETETSPFILWEYEGYVDECDGYTWQKEFIDRDYDGDGKNDRLSRKVNTEEQTADYTLEFGNGEKLICPKVWDTGFPHVQGGDTDGDGTNEILVTFSYDTGTDPYSYGDMWLFHKDGTTGEYREVDLPLAKGENGSKGFIIEYDKPENGRISFTIKETGFSMEEEADDDYISMWWTDKAASEMRCIYKAEILGGNNPGVRCYLAPLPRNSLSIVFDLNYKDGKYEIGKVSRDSAE